MMELIDDCEDFKYQLVVYALLAVVNLSKLTLRALKGEKYLQKGSSYFKECGTASSLSFTISYWNLFG